MGNLFASRERDNYTEKDFGEEIRESMSEYAMYVAYDRSVPCIIDGLKPVQRRSVYASWNMGQRPNGKTSKCAKLVGEVMGNFHPHGDGSIYESIVKLTSPTTARYNLFFERQGNFGDAPMGDSAAAPRYTETKINEVGALFLAQHESLPYAPNYDGSQQEPVYLCPAFPAFLLNESVGIGTGISGSNPGHTLVDICNTTEHLLNNPQASDEELFQIIKGPEYPIGGNLMDFDTNRAALRNIYTRGRGTLYFEATWRLEPSDDPAWKVRLVVDSFCPGMTIYSFTEGYLNTLVKQGLIGFKDDSAGSDNVCISLYANSNNTLINNVIPQLRSFHRSYNMTAVDLIKVIDQETGEERFEERLITATLKYAIGRWYKFRSNLLTDHFTSMIWSLNQDLWKAEVRYRLTTEAGLIDMIRASSTPEELDHVLREIMGLNEEQAAYVLRIRLGTLIKMNSGTIQEEIDAINHKINLSEYNRSNLKEYIIEELREVRTKYGDSRRTTLFQQQPMPEREEVNYLLTVKEMDNSLVINDSWPANGVGLTKTRNAVVAHDRVVLATYDGNMIESTAESLVSFGPWYAAGVATEKDDIMVIVDDNNKVDYRWIPEDFSRKLRLTPRDGTLIHATGITSTDQGVIINLNGNAWSFLSRTNLEKYAVNKVGKFWSYQQDKKTYATQVIRVSAMDDIVDALGQPISFDHGDDDLISNGKVFVVSDTNMVVLKSGRISYMDRTAVFSRWENIVEIFPLGNKQLKK
ncbi:DNA gyrase subunit A [Ewingella americana]|uniref:Topo IIA-type catalytic domain-containing protein n=1 Tax=Ewingella americana TaxID=41202 RepID=A0A502GCR6_9GAMM|nr:DNA gyrase subunit A [Ewingella americana]TPG60067.1 hypothetical protein EAH77_15990 [Ewingella americana]